MEKHDLNKRSKDKLDKYLTKKKLSKGLLIDFKENEFSVRYFTFDAKSRDSSKSIWDKLQELQKVFEPESTG